MKVKFKKLTKEATIPTYAHETDAGMDMYAISKKRVIENDPYLLEYGTGIAVEIPRGYVGLLFPRSSVYKSGMTLCNCVGVIDSGYRGEIIFKFYARYHVNDQIYDVGDRVGQLVILPYPKIEAVEADELEESDRGANGYGSTGAD